MKSVITPARDTQLHSRLSYFFFSKKTPSHLNFSFQKKPLISEAEPPPTHSNYSLKLSQSLSGLATELSIVWLPARFLSSFLVSRKNLEHAPGQLNESV